MIVNTNKIFATFLALLCTANAQTPEENIGILVEDVKSHSQDYLSYAASNPGFTIPNGLVDVYNKMTTATDDSYKSLYSQVDVNQFSQAVTQLPWYQSRLEPLFAAEASQPTPGAASPATSTPGAPQLAASSTESASSISLILPVSAVTNSSSSGTPAPDSINNDGGQNGQNGQGGASTSAANNQSSNTDGINSFVGGAQSLSILSTGFAAALAGVVGLLL